MIGGEWLAVNDWRLMVGGLMIGGEWLAVNDWRLMIGGERLVG